MSNRQQVGTVLANAVEDYLRTVPGLPMGEWLHFSLDVRITPTGVSLNAVKVERYVEDEA